VKNYLSRNKIENTEDLQTELESWAYIIARHFNISLLEVYSMPKPIFQQSLVWAIAVSEEREKDREFQKQKAKSKGNETVKLDYSFLDEEL
jgi:hypothetical protein